MTSAELNAAVKSVLAKHPEYKRHVRGYLSAKVEVPFSDGHGAQCRLNHHLSQIVAIVDQAERSVLAAQPA